MICKHFSAKPHLGGKTPPLNQKVSEKCQKSLSGGNGSALCAVKLAIDRLHNPCFSKKKKQKREPMVYLW